MNRLKENRIALGLKQEEVASMCGIKQGFYSKIENGKQQPSVKVAKKLGDILKMDWTSFFA